MANKTRPRFEFYETDDGLRIRLVGNRGGLRHTYGQKTAVPAQDRQAIIEAVAELRTLLLPDQSRVTLVKGE